jgi:Flavin containing amine oxidoreductase
LPFYQRKRIYHSADRGKPNLSFLNIGKLFLLCERQEMRMKHDEPAEFPGHSSSSGLRSRDVCSRGRNEAKSGRCGRRTGRSFLRLRASQTGLEAIVLEGQGRAGGRVQTLREDLDWGLSAETGATRIPDTHHMTLNYVREFGLTLEPFERGDLADVLHLRGMNYVSVHGREPYWPLQLKPSLLTRQQLHLSRITAKRGRDCWRFMA